MSISRNESIQKSIQKLKKGKEKPLIEKNDIYDTDVDKIASNIAKSPKFLLMVLMNSIICGMVIYFIDNYKYLGLIIVKNDKSVSTAFSISGLFNLLANLLMPTIWGKCDFYMSHLLITVLSLIQICCFLFMA